MCIHNWDDVEKAREYFVGDPIAFISGKTEHNSHYTNYNGFYAITVDVRHAENVMNTIKDLRQWHPDIREIDLTEVNQKRAALKMAPLVERRPRVRHAVKGFESSGLSFEQLMKEIRGYNARRSVFV